jgi:hypothetical protein
MSFRCGICSKAQPVHSTPKILVLEKRQRHYPERTKNNRVIDRGGVGWEIAREVQACTDCAEEDKKANQ